VNSCREQGKGNLYLRVESLWLFVVTAFRRSILVGSVTVNVNLSLLKPWRYMRGGVTVWLQSFLSPAALSLA